MKRFLGLALVIIMMLSMAAANAEDMGVQIISAPAQETEEVSLDDLKLNTEVTVEGWGMLKATSYDVVDTLRYYPNTSYTNTYSSGEEADYAILSMDILNITTVSHDYLLDCTVKVVFDEDFEFAGWCYQRNFDYSNKNAALGKNLTFSIDPMYVGHYYFGCTLPNAVIDSKAPLYMVITIDGNEITYNIRK